MPFRPPSGGPVRWTDLELTPDVGPPDEQRPSARDVTSPAQDLASPEELTARMLREWQDEVAASCDPLVRDGFRRP